MEKLDGRMRFAVDKWGYAALFFACLASVGTALARSNVLFIDLNNAASEIRAVRDSLPLNSELHVIPSTHRFNNSVRAQILEVQARIVSATKVATQCPARNLKQCRVQWAALRQLELQRERLTQRYGIEQIVEDISEIDARALDAIDIVVISGHHGNGYFRGEIAQLDIDDLLRVDAEFPALFGRVRTLILLGCDTGTPALFSDVFARLFPTARLMIGSEDSAPTRNEARNLRFIAAVLQSEASLQHARRQDDVTRIHRRLLGESWPVAMLWDRQHYFSRHWSGWLGAASALRATRSLSLAATQR
jgi:hypothetical protein